MNNYYVVLYNKPTISFPYPNPMIVAKDLDEEDAGEIVRYFKLNFEYKYDCHASHGDCLPEDEYDLLPEELLCRILNN